jgi:hypothetical protein
MSISAIGGGQNSAAQQVQDMSRVGHRHSGMRKAGMDAAAKALGMSTSDLLAARKSGQSLASIAQAKGVSIDSVTSAISAALTKADPSLSADRAQQIAQRMVNGPGSAGSAAVDVDHDGDSH